MCSRMQSRWWRPPPGRHSLSQALQQNSHLETCVVDSSPELILVPKCDMVTRFSSHTDHIRDVVLLDNHDWLIRSTPKCKLLHESRHLLVQH